MIIKCFNCSKDVITYKSRPNKKYCSRECYGKHVSSNGIKSGANNPAYKGGSLTKSCTMCSSSFECKYNLRNKQKYCSKECGYKSMIGRSLPEETINKMKKTIAKKPKRPNKKCSVCSKIIKHTSEYCQQHKHLTEGYKMARVKQSKTVSGVMPKNMQRPGTYGNIKRGWYDINGKNMFFRSKWEVNYALYLDFLIRCKQIKKWSYEEDVFIFEKIVSGTRTYRPDFKIFNNDGSIEYHEVKGYMDAKSRTKIKRMAKYYPNIKLVVIGSSEYRSLKSSIGDTVMPY